MTPARSPSWFVRFATHASRAAARPVAFAAALSVVVAWALSGPFLGFSDTWQLLINTGTTVMTFLMVFLIQNTQYRDSEALHIKLDELIRATRGASNELLDLEELDEDELRRILRRYERLAAGARSRLQRG